MTNSFTIDYKIEEAYLEDDLENAVTNIKGEIIDDEVEIEIGIIEATYIDIITATQTCESILDVFDIDQKLLNYYEPLVDKNNPLFNYLLKRKNWLLKETYDNLFFINHVLVNDKYRGSGLGLAAIYRTIQKFAHNCRFTILEAIPLQFTINEPDERIRLGLNHLEQNRNKATANLKAYYKELGFVTIPDSNYMIVDLDLKRPNLKDIGLVDL